MPESLRTSAPLAFVSPSSYERLRKCRLREAFTQQLQAENKERSAAAVLGVAVHKVVEDLVKSGAIVSGDWRHRLDRAWNRAVLGQHSGDYPALPVDQWPNYNLMRARLTVAVERLRTLLVSTTTTTFMTEVELSGYEGKLKGRADLVLRGATHEVIDLKTGSATESNEHSIRESYQRQLMLYSALEAESSGDWPTAARVLSLVDGEIAIPIDQSECAQLAQDALSRLQDFNRAAPGEQPPTTSDDSCGTCPFAARCHAYWDVASTLPAVLSVAGVVTEVNRSSLGGVTLSIAASDGTLGTGSVLVQVMDAQARAKTATLVVGTEIWLVGLWRDPTRDAYRLGQSASIAVSVPSP